MAPGAGRRNADIFLLIGDVGMFLMGMDVMTRALRDIAGSNLRSVLAWFATTPMCGVLTGATVTRFDPVIQRHQGDDGGLCRGWVTALAARDLDLDHLTRLQDLAEHRTRGHRRGLLPGERVGLYTLAEVFARTDATRWLQRSVHHAERIGHYDRIARRGLQQEAPPES